MRSFMNTLRARNRVLYFFGWLCLAGALVCMVMIAASDTVVMGINAWIKPAKFFLSIVIFCWSMGWYLYYLRAPRKTTSYSWMVVIVFTYEMLVIVWQAANGRLSHFNITNAFYMWLYNVMGIAIVTLVVWTAVIAFYFFRKRDFSVPMKYIWGIRLGLVMFIIFSFEGGVMSTHFSHTVGAADGGPGLPFINWSNAYGDLRVAHFFGMHALQLLPLTGYFVTRNSRQLFLVAALYFACVSLLLVQALKGIPLIKV